MMRSIVIASRQRGSGKTTTTINLAGEIGGTWLTDGCAGRFALPPALPYARHRSWRRLIGCHAPSRTQDHHRRELQHPPQGL